MQHGTNCRRFGRKSEHRQAMFSNLAASPHQARAALHHARQGQGILQRVIDKYISWTARRSQLAPAGALAQARRGDGEAMVKRSSTRSSPRYKTIGGPTRWS